MQILNQLAYFQTMSNKSDFFAFTSYALGTHSGSWAYLQQATPVLYVPILRKFLTDTNTY